MTKTARDLAFNPEPKPEDPKEMWDVYNKHWEDQIQAAKEEADAANSAKSDFLGHLVDAGLTSHAERHVEGHGVAQHELVRGRSTLTNQLRQGVFVLSQCEHIDKVNPADHSRGWVALWEGRPVFTYHRIVLFIGLLESLNLLWRRFL